MDNFKWITNNTFNHSITKKEATLIELGFAGGFNALEDTYVELSLTTETYSMYEMYFEIRVVMAESIEFYFNESLCKITLMNVYSNASIRDFEVLPAGDLEKVSY